MTTEKARDVAAVICNARKDALRESRDKRHEDTQDSIEDAQQKAFDDGYLHGVTVSREIIENHILPLIASLEAVVNTMHEARLGRQIRAHTAPERTPPRTTA